MIGWYILFCLTTAVVGIIQIYSPLQKKLIKNHIDNIVTKKPILGYSIFFAGAFISSPILFLVLLSTGATESFINHMIISITEH